METMSQLQEWFFELEFEQLERIRQYMLARYNVRCSSLAELEQAVYDYVTEDWFDELSEVID